MNARRRSTTQGLPSRVYEKHGAWYWVRKSDAKWLRLCAVADGWPRMLEVLAATIKQNEPVIGAGDFTIHAKDYIKSEASKKAASWRKDWERQGEKVCLVFRDWNVAQVDAGAIASWLLAEWPDKLHTRRIFRAWLSGFFSWAILRNLRTDNPCQFVKLEKPAARDVYIPDEHFLQIRAALAIGKDGKKTPTGAMMQCLVDLCFLTTQRSTEIRALKWSDIDHVRQLIRFKPSKTLKTTGGRVDWPLTKAIEEVLLRASGLKPESEYVIHDEKTGAPKTTGAAHQAWVDACIRAGLAVTVDGLKEPKPMYTLKDIRAKALTDAEKQGYSLAELAVAAVHADPKTTEIYLKGKKVPRSVIELELPKSK